MFPVPQAAARDWLWWKYLYYEIWQLPPFGAFIFQRADHEPWSSTPASGMNPGPVFVAVCALPEGGREMCVGGRSLRSRRRELSSSFFKASTMRKQIWEL